MTRHADDVPPFVIAMIALFLGGFVGFIVTSAYCNRWHKAERYKWEISAVDAGAAEWVILDHEKIFYFIDGKTALENNPTKNPVHVACTDCADIFTVNLSEDADDWTWCPKCAKHSVVHLQGYINPALLKDDE